MRTLVIDREKWLRGNMPDLSSDALITFASQLYNQDARRMCCLGFEAIACGYTQKEISGEETPAKLVAHSTRMLEPFEWLVTKNGNVRDSQLAIDLMGINDADVGDYINNIDISEELKITLGSERHREQLIAEYFAKGGVKVKFIN